jgi:hypothetical protein
LIDWIEYYRIVGPISTFVIYDDRSTDNVTLLQGFYRERGVNVAVIDAPSQKHEGVDGQTRSFAHCLQHVPSDWTLVVDTDEFIWAPNHCTESQVPAAMGRWCMVQLGITKTQKRKKWPRRKKARLQIDFFMQGRLHAG